MLLGARNDIVERLRRMVRLDVTTEGKRLQLEKVLGRNLEAALRRLQQQHGGGREVNVTLQASTTNKKNVVVRIEGTAVAVQASDVVRLLSHLIPKSSKLTISVVFALLLQYRTIIVPIVDQTNC